MRFLTSMVTNDGQPGHRQFTAVELVVTTPTRQPFRVAFFVPSEGFRDASTDAKSMGDAPVSAAMDSWDTKWPDTSMLRKSFAPVAEGGADMRQVEDAKRAYDPAGTKRQYRIVVAEVPMGPCAVTCAWMHDPIHAGANGGEFVLVPTFNVHLDSWRHQCVVMGADTSPYGEQEARPLARALRWDLAAAAGMHFTGTTGQLVQQMSGALPFHDLMFPVDKRDPGSPEYVSVSGGVIRDDTEQRLVGVYDVSFQPVVIICGAVVRNGYNYGPAHVPMTVTESMTSRYGPLRVEDTTPRSRSVRLRLGPNTYTVDLCAREKYGGVVWLTATRESPTM